MPIVAVTSVTSCSLRFPRSSCAPFTVSRHPVLDAVYCGMRVLCVGRHAFLSEHLCRYFGELGAQCEPAVGSSEVLDAAARFEPHVIICEWDLLTTTLLDVWSKERPLSGVPVLAVTLTRRPDDVLTEESSTTAAALYLPAISKEQGRALLAAMHRPRGVSTPTSWRMPTTESSAHIR